MISIAKSLWFKAANLGVDSSMPKSMSLRLRMLNQLMIIMILTSAFDSPMYFSSEEWDMLMLNGVAVFSFSLGLWFSAKKKLQVVQHYFVITTVLLITYSAYIMGHSVSFYVFIYPMSTIVYFLFNHNRTRIYYNVYFLIALITIIFFSFELNGGLESLTKPQLNMLYAAILGYITQAAALTFLHREFRHFMEEIVEKQNALKDAQDLARMGSWEFNKKNDRLSMSEQMTKMFSQLIDKKQDFQSVFQRIMPRPSVQKILNFKGNNKKSVSFNYKIPFLGGEKWFNVIIKKENPGKNKISGIIQDITERKIREQQIEQLLDEVQDKNELLEEQSTSLQETNKNLKRSNEELEQFAYIASHDLQEPLRMVGNFVQLLEEEYHEKLDKDGQTYINYAVRGVTRMSKLIDDLLQYSQVGRGKDKLKTIDVNELIQELQIDLSAFIKEKNAIIKTHNLPKALVCEAPQLNIVFQNLIHNGLKFNNSEQPQIDVEAIDRGEEYLFCVRDNGIGIDAMHYNRIFEIFKRLHRKEVYDGTGIGLSLCKRIILRHNGEIWLESKQGKGTTFYFTIPKKIKV